MALGPLPVKREAEQCLLDYYNKAHCHWSPLNMIRLIAKLLTYINQQERQHE